MHLVSGACFIVILLPNAERCALELIYQVSNEALFPSTCTGPSSTCLAACPPQTSQLPSQPEIASPPLPSPPR
ncbi:uncharacterized protein LY79DRAFT_540057 [Colletotrichum navitas]|uniref:Secreted protein n=1 Tax=Colletotrichum navitas TaxID=681940 RepID=A0AAD8Q8L7_9PEZI|nr:uncharacterized protein LY79DRAFT_540057 [Colletotrichum navitas]KAK1598050.1 hypothetical protein LY79DRAFT_540057 [Colletotrichum navitas]